MLAEEHSGRRPSTQTGGDIPVGDEVATQEVYLDDDQLFSQLCTATSVVKEASRPGIYYSHVNMCDGFVRIWRQWLAEMASLNDAEEISTTVDFDRYIWVGPARNVGLRFRVVLGPTERMPLLSGPDNDSPVSYNLIYKGIVFVLFFRSDLSLWGKNLETDAFLLELVVRTTMLLLAAEASAVQEVSRSSKAIVIAGF